MTNMENDNGTLADMSSGAESISNGQSVFVDAYLPSDDESDPPSATGEISLPVAIEGEYTEGENANGTATTKHNDSASERAEYERLIRTRFKEFYTDDTQKMINKRFKRYKAMEERLHKLEDRAEQLQKREAELDGVLASERRRVEEETERRVVASMLANRQRPGENGPLLQEVSAPT